MEFNKHVSIDTQDNEEKNDKKRKRQSPSLPSSISSSNSYYSSSSSNSSSSSSSSEEGEEEDEEQYLKDLYAMTHIYISVKLDKFKNLICYGFDVSSTPWGIDITTCIQMSLQKQNDGNIGRYDEEHKLLINRIIEMAFYDSSDEDRFTREDNRRWFDLSRRLFGKVLTSNDVGEWLRLSERDVTKCGPTISTIVHCDDM